METEWATLSYKKRAELVYGNIAKGEDTFINIALKDKVFLNRRRLYPLHIAVEYDNLASIELILGLGYPINKANHIQGSALQFAIYRRKYRAAISLINNGASLTWRNFNKESALSMATRYGNDAFIKFVFRKIRGKISRSIINSRYGDHGRTLLGFMAGNASIKSAATYKGILLMGANINKTITTRSVRYQSDTFLNQVVAWGDNKRTAELLFLIINYSKSGKLYSSFSPNLQDHKGNSVLHFLSARGAVKGLRLVLELEGTRIDMQNDNRKTPLNKAIRQGHEEVVRLLISRGSCIYKKSLTSSLYPFDHAVQEESFRAARIILKAGFNVQNSKYYAEIKAGKIPRLNFKEWDAEVPRLFDLSRDKIRVQLILGNNNMTTRTVDGLQLPQSLSKSLFIFN